MDSAEAEVILRWSRDYSSLALSRYIVKEEELARRLPNIYSQSGIVHARASQFHASSSFSRCKINAAKIKTDRNQRTSRSLRRESILYRDTGAIKKHDFVRTNFEMCKVSPFSDGARIIFIYSKDNYHILKIYKLIKSPWRFWIFFETFFEFQMFWSRDKVSVGVARAKWESSRNRQRHIAREFQQSDSHRNETTSHSGSIHIYKESGEEAEARGKQRRKWERRLVRQRRVPPYGTYSGRHSLRTDSTLGGGSSPLCLRAVYP